MWWWLAESLPRARVTYPVFHWVFPLRENVYKTACISKKNHLTALYIYTHIFGLLQNPSWDESIIVMLEYTSSNHVKLLDCLSDPQEPLINWISSDISSDTSPGPVDSCFICIHMHRFPVCIPSFCEKGKPLKPKHWLLRKLLQRWNLCQTYTNYSPALLHTKAYIQWWTHPRCGSLACISHQ